MRILCHLLKTELRIPSISVIQFINAQGNLMIIKVFHLIEHRFHQLFPDPLIPVFLTY